ncbi:hypothetical protein [Saccharomonospora piscinae]|uniref:hypothetical protein n=1 Tax=Saccharomonospora piscinae TaxID=687388 RepID=UPI0012DC46EA|nr:hypothetical protein [Saccharomonospora piscinae]
MPGTSCDGSQAGADVSHRRTKRCDADDTEAARADQFAPNSRALDTREHDAAWYYEQPCRGGRRHFTGNVFYVGGSEGQRLRTELAAIVGDLLRWTCQQQAASNHPGDTEHDQAA